MSELPASQPHRRLRTWVVLGLSLCLLMVMAVLAFWLWLRSDHDLRAFAAEMSAAGFDPNRAVPEVTDPVRLAQARSAEAAVRAIRMSGKGKTSSLNHKPLSAEFRAVHQAISSQAVCDAARAVIALGNAPIRVPPGASDLYLHQWSDLFAARLVVAEEEEFTLCLAAMRAVVEMSLNDDPLRWDLTYFTDLCKVIPHRREDRREQLRPLADWLESTAQRYLDGQPQLALHLLRQNLVWFRHGDQAFRERGASLPWWLSYPYTSEIALRVERASLLHEQLSWLQFVTTHPSQLRTWLDEAERRSAARAKERGWLGAYLHQHMLYVQNPFILRYLTQGPLHAQLLAADLRGSPWPVDLFDPAGGQVRRWEKDGRLIGAYSVGPDGRDDGGHSSRDIPLRLHLDPPDPPATP